MAAVRLGRRQLTDEVADHLRTRIMTGEIRPGEFIRLDETASALGCSVTPVREALVTLRGEGLVRSSPHRGFIVESLGRGDIVDIFWMQAELSARLATHAIADPDLPRSLTDLAEIVDELEKAVTAGNADRVLDREFAFHRRVNLMAHSKKLAWFLFSANKYSPDELYAQDSEWGRQAVASHRRLIGYLRDGDESAIREEIHARFADARDRLIRSLEAVGFWDEDSDADSREHAS
ncbi:MAG TPA: GntR family transcriptional regulator [Gordonia polyisoprenivorans]|uniref:GntR family transcriptional regulator n=1 Tax=Gordonia polyisoprenivorans TaxID=84595 RepID=A0A846WRJ5_9ACTN|nr:MULTISPECIES: GntR family transcriptional regulator [Gordonia]MBE7193193.1 GntR family transcriptional regulator [Gordonia polyisoprenivorans]MDF3281238.1 GntR family transcriptional regulator [Gordonia sp. N1V]NKY02941.1 GntR family transcriptional regulator [Gordonia polyisoprenivorans]OPX17110.1 GntR family transcriptional regulator [Gordonia sp. i37]OZC32791.1 GntR family transcriptional regulator [Gordonia polyisoprenivorans]